MNFKEMIKSDLEQIILNPNELGEEHIVGGRKITCIIDNDILKRQSAGLNISRSDLMLYAKCEDLPKRKGYGETLTVDEARYGVVAWDEDLGLASIELIYHT